MKYQIDGWNNFCRVFELPEKFSSKFCFGGGISTNFQMVDWFNPIQGLPQPCCDKITWENKVGKIDIIEKEHQEIYDSLVPWLRKKLYIKPDRQYLVICDFGATFIFQKEV
jgi:hypothetical protein